MMAKIMVGIVDDHALFRKGLAMLLNEGDVADVVLEAESGEAFFERYQFDKPKVLLLDLTLPGMGGRDVLQRLRKQEEDIKVIVITMHDDDQVILEVMEMGANGFLPKEAEPEEVEMAIQSVVKSGFYFNEKVSRVMLYRLVQGEKFKADIKPSEELSAREQEVLQLVCEEMTNMEIGEKLFISPRTVEGHRKKIMEKLGVRNAVGMVIYAIRKGWVNVGEDD